MHSDVLKPINDPVAMKRFCAVNNGWATFDGRIERMIKKIHDIEDECPHLHLECYGEELGTASVEQVAETEPRLVIPPPFGQLALFSGDAAA